MDDDHYLTPKKKEKEEKWLPFLFSVENKLKILFDDWVNQIDENSMDQNKKKVNYSITIGKKITTTTK